MRGHKAICGSKRTVAGAMTHFEVVRSVLPLAGGRASTIVLGQGKDDLAEKDVIFHFS